MGGHALHDHSLGGGLLCNMTAQTSTGRPVLKNGAGRTTVFACHAELSRRAHFAPSGGHNTIVGGNIHPAPDSTEYVLHLDQNIGRGMGEKDPNGVVPLRVRLTMRDGASCYMFAADEGAGETKDPNAYSWTNHYNVPPGYWAMQHGKSALNNAFLLSRATAGLDPGPGPGWLSFPLGYFIGPPSASPAPVFRGHISALRTNFLRQGRRRAGDEFIDGLNTTTLTTDGYRGASWLKNQMVKNGNAAWGLPATVIEPTANNGSAGQKVFKCTTAGTTGAVEPTTGWSSATVVGDTVTDNTAVWTLVGFTPSFVRTRGPGGGGQTTIAMANANQTLTVAQAAAAMIKATGILTVSRTLFFPTPPTDDAGYQRSVRAFVTGRSLLVDIVGGAAPITIAAGKTAIVAFDSAGASRVTADV